MFNIEASKFDTGLNLLNKVPQQLLYKVVSLSENEKINQGNIEVVVLFGDSLEAVLRSVEKIGGVFENLGFGFGIVTVKASDISRISELEGVLYVELPKVLFTSDYNSNRASCVINAWDAYGLTGEGTIVGFIDTGIDYTHPAFKDENGNTRIEYIYDLGEGRKVYNKSQINEALKAQNPLSIVNVRDPLGHGTHVAGIACAGGRIPRVNYGVAYKSSIIMVKTTRAGFLNYALSTQIMRGIKFLIDRSKELNRPIVINISLSTNDGAHNGTSLLEQYIETMCRLERVAIVIAAGNEGDAAHHAEGILAETNNIILSVSESEPSVSLQLYKPLLSELSIQITNPAGLRTGEIQLTEGYKEMNIGTDKCIIYNTGPKPFDINGEIIISILPSTDFVPSGQWNVSLKLLNKYSGNYNIWLPISEVLNTKTKFLNPSVYNTLGIPATVQSAISVGSYNYLTNSFSSFSGRGKIEEGFYDKPDLTAPGEEILSTVPGGGLESKSGTSMASPHVAGICALLLEWGIVKSNDPFLYGDRLKYYLSKGARRDRAQVTYPDPSWGYGTVCAYDSLGLLRVANVREANSEQINQPTDYTMVEYQGDIIGTVSKIQGANVYIIDENRAILISYNRNINDIVRELGEIIVYGSSGAIYTLCDISPVDASGAPVFQTNNTGGSFLTLNGSEVVVGIIDTGIDYLNQEFINENGTTRIIRMFDQTQDNGRKIEKQPFGSEFLREDINKAILEQRNGGDPYSIVPTKDEIGHGTSMASIVGARGVNPDVKGVAPKCEFIIYKLRQTQKEIKNKFGISVNIPTYYNVSIILAINYLYEVSLSLGKPLVVLLPLGTNMAGHNGNAYVERYIDEVSKNNEIIFVVPTGNQGEGFTHTSGSISKEGNYSSIELIVDKEQKDIRFEIWVDKPDKFALSIISPSGEIIERIPPKSGESTNINFIYEKTNMSITYSIPEEQSGDEKIVIMARNIREGIWVFRLIGDLVSTGRYNSWLPQKELLAPGTMFLKPNHYTTLTMPSSSFEAISVAFYNQNFDTIVEQSGRGFPKDTNKVKPEIAAGGINALTTTLGGETRLISGSSVAAAVVAGCSALIVEWGSVKGNDPGMYATKIKSYLISGTTKRKGDIYPNPEWGYGTVNMRTVFENIRSLIQKNYRETQVQQVPLAQQTSQVQQLSQIQQIPQTQPVPQMQQVNTESQVPAVSKKTNYFLEENNRNYLIEYSGDIVNAVRKYPNTEVYVIDEKRAVITAPLNEAIKIVLSIPEIIYVDPGGIFTLSAVSPIEASRANLFYAEGYLPLDGTGVIIGLIDSGIDYLNEEFVNEDGTTKILAMWDQTIEGDIEKSGLIQGTVYTKEDINNALRAKRNGEDPYEIVPSRDEIGHGTNMAGILVGRGSSPGLRGIASKSDLVVVKLKEASRAVRQYYGVYGENIVYRSTTYFLAIRYLYQYALALDKPLVIYAPIGSNNGAHNGESFIERYIDEISSLSGITVVVPCGNQGNTRTHTSGVIVKTGDMGIIELNIGSEQKNIRFEIWVTSPNKVALSITSPTGEVVERIPPKLKVVTEISFVYEETNMTVEYLIPEEISGEERITIVARNISEGIWQFKLLGEIIVDGRYDAWILPKEFLAPDTRFLNPDPQTTLTIPSTSAKAISVAYYDQNNNSIVYQSGRGYTRKNTIKPDIAAGGINQITTDINGGTKVISGSSVAGAVVAGCVALITQWGIVDKNDVTLYSNKVKTYLIRGTNKRPGDIYPNPEWGYGMLDMKGVFDNIRGLLEYENREIAPVPTSSTPVSIQPVTTIATSPTLPGLLINYFINDTNISILVEYKGDLVKAVDRYPNTDVFIIDERRAAVSIPQNQYYKIIKSIPEIVYVEPNVFYTLCDVLPVEASNALPFHTNVNFQLDGLEVVIGIVDSGIDYLNEEFINEDGSSKILSIWDQTIQGDLSKTDLIAGTEYTKSDIESAIQAKLSGGDPYSIVPSKDEIGHGTNMASILVGRGVQPELVGVAPGSNIVVVKGRPVSKTTRDAVGIYGDTAAYRGTGIFLAIRYLYQYALKINKPMVIYLPMGTNTGPHGGSSFIARYINEISSVKGICVVVPCGNQGNTNTHTSGVIDFVGDRKTIELRVGEEQRNIAFDIWINKPNKVSLSITSPTGEVIKKIVPKINQVEDITFVYEKTRMFIEFFIPEELTGDEKISIFAQGVKAGVWQFILIGDLITAGKYDAWLLQRELLAPGTAFLNPTTNTTLTVPSTSEKAISVGFYNQNNNSIIPSSGKGYTRTNVVKPDLVAGGVNQIVTSVGGTTQIISGSSVAGAIVAGCCALILQWGIVKKNDQAMYASKVKTYLIRGTAKRSIDVYPNPSWGYGMLDLKQAFDNIRSIENSLFKPRDTLIKQKSKEYTVGKLFIRLPTE